MVRDSEVWIEVGVEVHSTTGEQFIEFIYKMTHEKMDVRNSKSKTVCVCVHAVIFPQNTNNDFVPG